MARDREGSERVSGPDVRWVPLSMASPASVECILQWNLQVWGTRIPGYDEEGWRQFYERAKTANYAEYDGESELVWALFEKDALVGSIALVHEDDLPDFVAYSPWLAAFVIDPAKRHQGIGRHVVAQFEELSRSFGIAELFLWTDHYTHWYQTQGYTVLTHSRIGEIELDVMHKILR